MKTSELVEHTNLLTDEDFEAGQVVNFLNDAMAKINTECNANFPFLTLTGNEEPVFPEKWQRLLLCTFAAGRIKENDSSQFEYIDFYSQFDAALTDFKNKYRIPDEYRDPDAISYSFTDFTTSHYRWN
jgi:hypothetical protein